MSEKVDLSQYSYSFSLKNKIGRLVWNISYWLVFRPFSTGIFKAWRNFLLRFFGAKLGSHVHVYGSVKIWAPWNLELGDFSTLGPGVDCYNQGKIVIGSNTIISQKSYLCASSHDHEISNFPLILKPITIGDQVWIAADSFIGPGVTIGDGVVVGARSALFKDVEPWSIVGGNPAKKIKDRIINHK